MNMRRVDHYRFAVVVVLLCCTGLSHAQFFDSLEARAGETYRFSPRDYLPFWLISNQYGTVADRKSDFTSFARVSNKNVIGEHEYMNEHGFYDAYEISLSYGLSIFNNNHFRSTLIEEGFVKLV